jgi:hypothetical protein
VELPAGIVDDACGEFNRGIGRPPGDAPGFASDNLGVSTLRDIGEAPDLRVPRQLEEEVPNILE